MSGSGCRIKAEQPRTAHADERARTVEGQQPHAMPMRQSQVTPLIAARLPDCACDLDPDRCTRG